MFTDYVLSFVPRKIGRYLPVDGARLVYLSLFFFMPAVGQFISRFPGLIITTMIFEHLRIPSIRPTAFRR